MNLYETDKLLNEYLLFHYGSRGEVMSYADGPQQALGFAVRTVGGLPADLSRTRRALDLGCAVGRSSFELSKFCDHVLGIDFSNAFITAAEEIRTNGEKHYLRLEEAHATTQLVARRPESTNPESITFEVGDAMALRPDIGTFDVVHAANLICRLPDPAIFLARLPELVEPGGHLVLTTPCTWLGEFTPPEKWPDKPTIDWLSDHLAPPFELLETRDVPFLIRETARKFQWTVAQGSLWRKK